MESRVQNYPPISSVESNGRHTNINSLMHSSNISYKYNSSEFNNPLNLTHDSFNSKQTRALIYKGLSPRKINLSNINYMDNNIFNLPYRKSTPSIVQGKNQQMSKPDNPLQITSANKKSSFQETSLQFNKNKLRNQSDSLCTSNLINKYNLSFPQAPKEVQDLQTTYGSSFLSKNIQIISDKDKSNSISTLQQQIEKMKFVQDKMTKSFKSNATSLSKYKNQQTSDQPITNKNYNFGSRKKSKGEDSISRVIAAGLPSKKISDNLKSKISFSERGQYHDKKDRKNYASVCEEKCPKCTNSEIIINKQKNKLIEKEKDKESSRDMIHYNTNFSGIKEIKEKINQAFNKVEQASSKIDYNLLIDEKQAQKYYEDLKEYPIEKYSVDHKQVQEKQKESIREKYRSQINFPIENSRKIISENSATSLQIPNSRRIYDKEDYKKTLDMQVSSKNELKEEPCKSNCTLELLLKNNSQIEQKIVTTKNEETNMIAEERKKNLEAKKISKERMKKDKLYEKYNIDKSFETLTKLKKDMEERKKNNDLNLTKELFHQIEEKKLKDYKEQQERNTFVSPSKENIKTYVVKPHPSVNSKDNAMIPLVSPTNNVISTESRCSKCSKKY